MNEQHQTDLQIGDVESLLAGFLWLKHPPEPLALPRTTDLWVKAIDEAWEAERKHAEKKALAASVGKGGGAGAAMADLRRRKALRAEHEKLTSKPSKVGLCQRFRDMPEQVYRRVDPAYAETENEARLNVRNAITEARKTLALLLSRAKLPLLYLSELAASPQYGLQAWAVYLAAAERSDPQALDRVIQDLGRIRSKLESRGKGSVFRCCPRRDCDGELYGDASHYLNRNWPNVLRCDKCGRNYANPRGGAKVSSGHAGLAKPSENHKGLAREIHGVLAAPGLSQRVQETIRALAADRVTRRKKQGKIEPLFPPSESVTVEEMLFLLASFHDQLVPYTGLPRVCPPEWIDRKPDDDLSDAEIAAEWDELRDFMASDAGAQFCMYQNAVEAVMLSDSELNDLRAYLGDVKLWADEQTGPPEGSIARQIAAPQRGPQQAMNIGVVHGSVTATNQSSIQSAVNASPKDSRLWKVLVGILLTVLAAVAAGIILYYLGGFLGWSKPSAI